MKNLKVLGRFCDKRTAYWEPRSTTTPYAFAPPRRELKRTAPASPGPTAPMSTGGPATMMPSGSPSESSSKLEVALASSRERASRPLCVLAGRMGQRGVVPWE